MTTRIQPPPHSRPARPPAGPTRDASSRRLRIWLVVVAVVAVLALVALTVALVVGDDGGQGGSASPTPTITAVPTTAPTAGPSATTASPTATTAPSASTAPPVDVDTATAVWPVRTSNVRYLDPVAAARGFATDFAGFNAPVVGSFRQGDSRSGEVEVRPSVDGPATTVFVRKLEDDRWWVLGAAAARIRLDTPSAGDTIRSPVRLTGAAHTFEGNVAVTIREDGVPAALGTGSVMGAGDGMGRFDGEVALTRTPGQAYGAILLAEYSARDGSLWQVSVVRIHFAL